MDCEEAVVKWIQPSVVFDWIIIWPIPVTVRSKAYVCCYLTAGDRGFQSR